MFLFRKIAVYNVSASSPIFAADTKIIFDYNFAAPLAFRLGRCVIH